MPETTRKRHIPWTAVVFLGLIAAVIVIPRTVHLGGPSAPDMPASFGPGNTCYYVMSPAEVASLKRQGKCQQNDVAAQVPHAWLVDYYPFYDSSWYRSTIVVKSDRTSYDTFMTTFGKANATEIGDAAPKARYVDGSGSVVTGSDAGVSGDGESITGGGGDSSGGHGGTGEDVSGFGGGGE